jgi:protoheme IX farnesyltransferase
VSLIVFCAVIGMFLAVPDLPPPAIVFAATLGIALVAGAAAAINCLVEQKIDAAMYRTRRRPLPSGDLTPLSTLVFAGLVGGAGLWLLYRFVNPLTMWLTLATFVGYAIVYTVLLKPATPQNIVIGGASGAMPPVLGWAAVTGEVSAEALILFLIIFSLDAPAFLVAGAVPDAGLRASGAADAAGHARLPLHAADDRALHAGAGRRDLPSVCHPDERAPLSRRRARPRRSVRPLCAAVVRDYSDALARKTFRYSIVYLAALFSALLVDHYFR